MPFQIKEHTHNTFMLLAILIAIALMIQKNTIHIIIADFKNKKFLIYISIIAFFSYVVFKSGSNTDKEIRFKEATRKALAALLIAYFAHLDMFIAPFFIVFASDYFLSGKF